MVELRSFADSQLEHWINCYIASIWLRLLVCENIRFARELRGFVLLKVHDITFRRLICKKPRKQAWFKLDARQDYAVWLRILLLGSFSKKGGIFIVGSLLITRTAIISLLCFKASVTSRIFIFLSSCVRNIRLEISPAPYVSTRNS